MRRFPHQLSGGQQQRVVLAQALLLGARVIVADEPTTGQDALTKRRIVAELERMVRQGIALVLLSHDLDVVRALADEVVVLREGRVVESGPAGRILLAPEHPWTRELLAAGPEVPEPRSPGPGEPGPGGQGTAKGDAPAPGLQLRIAAARYRGRSGSRPDAPSADRSARRGSVVALRDVSLDVAPGSCLAVVGRSGSGKTTLGRCAAGLHRDWDGAVTLDGESLPRSVRDRSADRIAALQYVFQDARAAFDEHRTVLAQTARTAVRLRGVPGARAREEARAAFTRVGSVGGAGRAAARPAVRRRAATCGTCRALLARPRVLVCDEITSGLDAASRRGIVELLGELLRERTGTGLVLITHDLDTAAALADRIAVLDGGEVVEAGPAARVLTAPTHPFTASLVAAATVAHRGGAPLRGVRRGAHSAASASCHHRSRPGVQDTGRAHRFTTRTVRPRPAPPRASAWSSSGFTGRIAPSQNAASAVITTRASQSRVRAASSVTVSETGSVVRIASSRPQASVAITDSGTSGRCTATRSPARTPSRVSAAAARSGLIEEHAVCQLLHTARLPGPGEGDPRRLRVVSLPGVFCML